MYTQNVYPNEKCIPECKICTGMKNVCPNEKCVHVGMKNVCPNEKCTPKMRLIKKPNLMIMPEITNRMAVIT